MKWLYAKFRSGAPSVNGVRRAQPLQGQCGMALSLVVGLVLTLLAIPAFAQSANLYWQCVPPSAANQGSFCAVSNQYPLPNGPSINSLVPVVGTQRGVVISSATGMTIPTGATVAFVQAQGTNTAAGVCLFWQDDGTDPTNAAGIALGAPNGIWVKTSAAFKMFAATGATCTASIAYYK